jgi:hypothetical protein
MDGRASRLQLSGIDTIKITQQMSEISENDARYYGTGLLGGLNICQCDGIRVDWRVFVCQLIANSTQQHY